MCVFVPLGCSGAKEANSSDPVPVRALYFTDHGFMARSKPFDWPRFDDQRAPGEYDVYILLTNGHFPHAMTLSLDATDSEGTKQVWKEKYLPKGYASFEMKPTPERMREAVASALVRVTGKTLTIRVFSKEGPKTECKFLLSRSETNYVEVLATLKQVMIKAGTVGDDGKFAESEYLD